METDTCLPFNFGGCQGNANRFDTIVQCEQRCRKNYNQDPDEDQRRIEEEQERLRAEQEDQRRRQEYEDEIRRLQQQRPQQPDVAETLPEETEEEQERGRAREAEEERRRQEYYDELRRRQQAEEEERRRLELELNEDDEGTTIRIESSDICDLPVEVGPCRASVPSYYFDQSTGRCTAFLYGGCQGNANRFESEESCQRACGNLRGVGK